MRPIKIVLIGSGAVAEQLTAGLAQDLRYVFLQIYGRSLDRPTALRSLLSNSSAVQCITRLEEVDTDADIYLFSVVDDALPQLWQSMPHTSGLWLHTAGSVPLSAMAQYHDRVGVLYPLQTFSRGVQVDWSQIPLYIEASDAQSLDQLHHLASALSPKVHLADSQQRTALHLSAVLACNFANHLWALAGQVLEEYRLPPDSLQPLIAETFRKTQTIPPALGQTGPARRGDHATMGRHLALLEDKPQLRELYQRLSESIARLYSPEG